LQFPQIFVALDEPQAPQTFGSSAANFIATRSCAFVGFDVSAERPPCRRSSR